MATDRTQTSYKEWWRQQSHSWAPFKDETSNWLGLCDMYNVFYRYQRRTNDLLKRSSKTYYERMTIWLTTDNLTYLLIIMALSTGLHPVYNTLWVKALLWVIYTHSGRMMKKPKLMTGAIQWWVPPSVSTANGNIKLVTSLKKTISTMLFSL